MSEITLVQNYLLYEADISSQPCDVQFPDVNTIEVDRTMRLIVPAFCETLVERSRVGRMRDV